MEKSLFRIPDDPVQWVYGFAFRTGRLTRREVYFSADNRLKIEEG
jgi:hypothetical protein